MVFKKRKRKKSLFVIAFPILSCNSWQREVQLSTFFLPLHKYLGAAFSSLCELKGGKICRQDRGLPRLGTTVLGPSTTRITGDTPPPQGRTSPQPRIRAEELIFFPRSSIQQRHKGTGVFPFRCHANTIEIIGWLWL